MADKSKIGIEKEDMKFLPEDEFKQFQDNFNPNRNTEQDIANEIARDINFKGKYREESDMFCCLSQNNKINDKKCQIGNELCVSCQLINQAYHKLKKNYLINRAGRACTYRKGRMFCLGTFDRIYRDDNMSFQKRFKCNGKKAQCEPCKEMAKYIKDYYGENLYNSIIERDKKLGYSNQIDI